MGMTKLRDWANIMILRALVAGATALPGAAMAQALPGGGGPIDRMVSSICGLIGPLAGANSKVLSLVFLIALGVMMFMWWMSENKEGVITWVLRTGLALAVLINLFTLPTLVGLQSLNCGSVF